MSLSAIPYNRVQTSGNILFATRGGKIRSFNLSDSKHISTWQHPDLEKYHAASKAHLEAKSETETPLEAENAPATEESEPPAKRQKLENGSDLNVATEENGTKQDQASATTEGVHNQAQKKHKGGKGKNKKDKGDRDHGETSRMARIPDQPIITLMTCTPDGKHLIAVSGHDKAVWVFEHDGHGKLNQLSQRVMPKRPSAITIGYGPHIIVADKFGDVYHLTLLVDPLSSTSLSVRTTTTSSTSEPAANTLTVHSKRNREALENQRKQLEKQKNSAESKPDGPGFELTLLLGHVSMLTSLAVAESEGRKFILTSDRDEHIRVSRYIPQAHIIEGFCLGHKEFVSEILIPVGKEQVLISGGGDEDLFIWDWKSGKLLSKTNMLHLAQEIAPDASKVAISGMSSFLYPTESGLLTYILAICEDVRAIFTWQLTDENQLKNPGIIQLPGNPLHVTTNTPAAGEAPKLIVAMDPREHPEAKSLHAYTLARTEARLSSDVELPIHGDRGDDSEMQVSESDLRVLFYNVEHLRKQTSGGDEDAPLEENEPAPEGDVEGGTILVANGPEM